MHGQFSDESTRAERTSDVSVAKPEGGEIVEVAADALSEREDLRVIFDLGVDGVKAARELDALR